MVLAAFLALLCCWLLHILRFLRNIALAFNDLHLHAKIGDKSARGKCFSKYRILEGLPEIKKQRAPWHQHAICNVECFSLACLRKRPAVQLWQ